MDDPGKIRSNIAAYKAAIAAGTHTQEDLDEYIKEAGTLPEQEETRGERVAGAISAGYQGLTFGAGNKITAGIRTVLPEAIGGTDGFDFSTALKEQTDVLENYRRRHGVEAGALELAGSLPTVAATGGFRAAAAGTKALARLGKLSAQGAGYGAAGGGLSANRVEDVVPGTLRGAAVGAVAAPVVGHLASGLARHAAVGKTMRQALGTGPRTAPEKAQGVLTAALRKGGVDPDDAANTLNTEHPTSMMELGSRNVATAARAARNVPTSNAAQTLDRFVNERGAGAGRRIEEGLTRGTGRTATDVQEPVEKFIERRAEKSQPLYEKAESYGEIKNPETVNQIKSLRNRHPVFEEAWERGQKLVSLEKGDAAPPGLSAERFAELQAQGLDKYLPASMLPSAAPTVAQINAWKKGLDAVIESRAGSTNALARSEARALRNQLSSVLKKVDDEVPDFKAARGEFRGHSELAEASESGANHFKPNVSADYLKRTIPALSPGEQEAYRANALNSLVAKLRGMGASEELPEGARGVNIVQRLFGTQDAVDRARMLFSDEASFDKFLTQLEQEALYPKTQRFLTGQSSTAAQEAEKGVAESTWRDAAIAVATGSPYAKVRFGTRIGAALTGANRGMQPAVADALAQQASQTGVPLQQLLRQMSADDVQRLLARSRATKVAGNSAAAGSGLLGTPQSY